MIPWTNSGATPSGTGRRRVLIAPVSASDTTHQRQPCSDEVGTMTGTLRLTRLEFKAGCGPDAPHVTIEPSTVVVLIGPNNAGKSLARREIETWCVGEDRDPKVESSRLAPSGAEAIKRGISLLDPVDHARASALRNELATYGLFLVPLGELEAWLAKPRIEGHTPKWLIAMLARLGWKMTQHSSDRELVTSGGFLMKSLRGFLTPIGSAWANCRAWVRLLRGSVSAS
jgi:hypothetical protein